MKRGIIIFVIVAAFIMLARGTMAGTCTPREGHMGCFVNIAGQDLSDYDCDCVPDIMDNCPVVYNPFQEDANGNGVGDACEPAPPVNNPPVWSGFSIPAISCQGSTTVDVLSSVSDDHTSDGNLIISAVSSDPAILVIKLSQGSFRIQHITQSSASATVTFTAQDGSGLSSTVRKQVSVQCVIPNAPPVLRLYDFTLLCNDARIFDLRTMTADENVNTVSYTLLGNTNPDAIRVQLDSPIVAYLSKGVNGESMITIRASDDKGATGQDTLRIKVEGCVAPVNQPPVIKGIPDQSVVEGTSFAVFDLDSYSHDSDNTQAELSFSVSGNSKLGVSLDTSTHVVKVSYPAGFTGMETLTFKVVDPKGASDTDSATFEVTPKPHVNQPPVFFKDIPGQAILCHGSFSSIDLRNYVSDPDNAFGELLFQAAGYSQIAVSISNGIITLKNPGKDVQEKITIKASDPLGLFDTSSAIFTVSGCAPPVNKPPVIDGIPDQGVYAGETFMSFDLDDYSYDPDNTQAELSFSVSGNTRLSVSIDKSSHVAKVSYPEGFLGKETLTFKVVDPKGASDTDSATFEVREKPQENKPPRFGKELPGASITCEGSFASYDLRDYVSDPDNAFSDLRFSVSGNGRIGAHIANGILYLANPGVNTGEHITVTVRDPAGLSDSSTAYFEVTGCGGANNPPTLSIPDQHLSCDQDKQIDLRSYASDEHVDTLSFSVSSVSPSGIVSASASAGTLTLSSLGNDGKAAVKVRATDDQGQTGYDTFTVMVDGCEEPPVENKPPRFIEEVPDQTIQCDESFDSINLKSLVTDPDDSISDLRFSASGNDLIDVSISDGIVHLSNPEEDVAETITFKVTDPHGASDTSSARFRVKGCEEDEEEEIELSGIPDQTVCFGDDFDRIDLEDYVDGGEGALDFAVEDEDDLDVYVAIDGQVSIDYHDGFIGQETLTFIVEDETGRTARDSASFRVKDCGDDDWDDDHDDWDHRHYRSYFPIPTIRFVEFKPEPLPNTQCMVLDRLTHRTLPDWDCDGIPDDRDNCPRIANFNQRDMNANKIGDACDLSLETFTITPLSVPSGSDTTVTAIIRNKLGRDVEDIRLRASIDELGITGTQTIDSLKDGESDGADFTFRIPACTPAKDYIVKFKAEYNGRDEIVSSGKLKVTAGKCSLTPGGDNVVDVYNIQDVPPGGSAIFPIRITNQDDYAKSYTVRLVGVDGWGSYSLDTGSVVVVQPFGERTVNAFVYANEDAGPGEHSFMAEIKTEGVVQQVILVADVKGEEKQANSTIAIIVLEYVLVSLVIIAIILGVSYAVQKRRMERTIARS